MKVGIFADTFLPTMDGVVRSTCLLIEQLVKRGVEVEVFAPGKRNETKEYKGAKIHYFKGRKLFFYPKYFFTVPHPTIMKYLMESGNIDVFHLQDPFMIGIAGLRFAKKMKKPVVGTYHTFYEEYIPHITGGIFKNFVKEILKFPARFFVNNVYSKCDITIAPTKEIKDYLKEHGVEKVKVIPTGVDLKFFKRKNGKNIRKKYGIPKNAFVFVYAGRVSFEKKIEILLHAFKMIQEKEKNVYLIIAGDGPSLKEYKQVTKNLNIKHVKFTGYVSDKELISCYCSSNVFVSPSDTETQGLTFLEAMACGLPIIGARKRGARSMVKRKAGLLFRPMDINDLYKKMSFLLKNEKKRLKLSRGAHSLIKKLSVENFGKEHLKLYKKIIRKYKIKSRKHKH